MNRSSLHHAILRAAALLAPAGERAEWLAGWRSELWYVPRRSATLFCLGAFQDALWVRRDREAREDRATAPMASATHCLATLSAVAVGCFLMAALLLGPLRARTVSWHLTIADLPAACLQTAVLSLLVLPGILLRRPATHHHAMPWSQTLRYWTFLALKFALIQPAMVCGLFLWILIAPLAPFAPVFLLAGWILGLRWVFSDQRSRCPRCLCLLINPVRIGTSSSTFLEWHGAESICPRGHGLLHDPAISAIHSGDAQWLGLDPSWSGLFTGGGTRS